MASSGNRYEQLIAEIFRRLFRPGLSEVEFSRNDIIKAATQLNIDLPKNLGDVLYSFRYRSSLRKAILKRAPSGKEWIIRPAGRSQYRFVLIAMGAANITPAKLLAETKIPDATPGVIAAYALTDEQALLARLRYNRLIDIFTGLACYSLQSHLRTTVQGLGQVETDEIYVGIDKRGVHYIIPAQAKAGKTKWVSCRLSRILRSVKRNFRIWSACRLPRSSWLRESLRCFLLRKARMASR